MRSSADSLRHSVSITVATSQLLISGSSAMPKVSDSFCHQWLNTAASLRCNSVVGIRGSAPRRSSCWVRCLPKPQKSAYCRLPRASTANFTWSRLMLDWSSAWAKGRASVGASPSPNVETIKMWRPYCSSVSGSISARFTISHMDELCS